VIALYLLLAVGGLIGTWAFNIASFAADEDYLGSWFASAASSSAAVDVLVVAVAACVFFVVEGRRLGMRHTWVLIPLTFAIALAFIFPLFLAWREWTMKRTRMAGSEPAP
jgi:ABC-type uncharacterized transport system permease subunit